MSNSTPENQDTPAQNAPWYKKKPVMIGGGLIAFFIVVGMVNGPSDTPSSPEPSDTSNSSTDENVQPEVTEEPTLEPEVTQEPEPEITEEPEPEGPVETLSQSNARSTAEDYIASSGFSRSGLIDQLKYEEYSTADATYAVDAIDVDWNEQAARTAQSYLDSSSFSRSGLYDQLIYEGFTSSQANFGLKAVGY
jgi:hypothetical protein